MLNNYLLFGGTFDPIHNAHLTVAQNVQQYFKFEHFIFLPCKIPLLKEKSHATIEQRVAMLNIALEEGKNASFEIDLREMLRDSPSYMVTTLLDYRKEKGEDVSLTILLGLDAFAQLQNWYQWKKLIHLANILIISRPSYFFSELPQALVELIHQHKTMDKEALRYQRSGNIYCFDAGIYNLSSTAIRHQIKTYGSSPDMPNKVGHYIQKNKLYV